MELTPEQQHGFLVDQIVYAWMDYYQYLRMYIIEASKTDEGISFGPDYYNFFQVLMSTFYELFGWYFYNYFQQLLSDDEILEACLRAMNKIRT